MGGGYGGSYSNTSSSVEALNRNIAGVVKTFPVTESDYFGQPGLNRRVRVLKTKNPADDAKRLFDSLSRGGRKMKITKSGVIGIRFDDGSHVIYRKTSKSGGPVVEIHFISKRLGIAREQKIHFESES